MTRPAAGDTDAADGEATGGYDEALGRLTAVVGRAATEAVEATIPHFVELLQDAGVRAIVLKGPVTRQRLYRSDEVRPTADVDLLVDPRSFRRATRALAGEGYLRVERHGHSDTLRREGGEVDVDLHLTLPYVTARPRRAFSVFASHVVSLVVAGTAVPVLDEPAHAVHLAIHAAVNRFDPASRTMGEWRRGLESLTDEDSVIARHLAAELGVGGVWDLARRAVAGTEATGELVAALPLWEIEPRMVALRRGARSGVPTSVRWRDAQRMVTLQLGDGAVNTWRADRGRPPLVSGTWSIRFAKLHRLATVTLAGLVRLSRRQR